MRGRNCSVVGCSVLQAVGRGIMIFGPVSSGAVVTFKPFAETRRAPGSASTPREPLIISITGSVVKNCEGPAIDNGGSNIDIVISGNVIQNLSSIVAGAAIQLRDAARIVIAGNNVGSSAQGGAIAMLGNSDSWQTKPSRLVDAMSRRF
jgi:hypothetical protein